MGEFDVFLGAGGHENRRDEQASDWMGYRNPLAQLKPAFCSWLLADEGFPNASRGLPLSPLGRQRAALSDQRAFITYLVPTTWNDLELKKMNIAPEAIGSLKHQRPTVLLALNFTTRPFPHGPFDLGTLVEDLKNFYPINQGADNRVPIPAGQQYADVKEDVHASAKLSHSGEASLLTRVLDRSTAGDVSLRGQKSDEDVYRIERLETVYFYPPRSYVQKCLQLPDVRAFHEMSGFAEPVYLVTGLKLAWGATVAAERGRSYDATAQGSIAVPAGALAPAALDASLGSLASKAQWAAASDVSSSFGKPADFVLGIQVQKIYHKREFIIGERVLTTERVQKGAVLVDNDELPDVEGDAELEAGLEDFVLADLDETDAEGLVSWTD